MRTLTRPLRIEIVRVADLRSAQMGLNTGIKARFTLEDNEARPIAFAICHVFSPRTYEILDELYAEMEKDVARILERDDGVRENLEITHGGITPDSEDEDPGLTFR